MLSVARLGSAPASKLLRRSMLQRPISLQVWSSRNLSRSRLRPFNILFPSRSGQSAHYSTVVVQNTRRGRWRRVFFLSVVGLSAFAVAFLFGTDNFYPLPGPFMSSIPTDAETLSLYNAPDAFTSDIDNHIRTHPLAQRMRQDPQYVENRPHLKIPKEAREHNLTAGTLSGKGKIVVPPLFFIDKSAFKVVSIFYLGSDVSGHPGTVHGGLLATLLDEGLARCCFPALPNKVGMTAMLNVQYKKPAKTGSFFVLRASTTKIEGRKAWVEGHIETLVEDGEEPEILVTANALFIEPKIAKIASSLYKVT